MVSLEQGQRTLSVRWPDGLPQPSLDGATATYAEVLPGVDLQLTAMPDGYREVLRVKSAEADPLQEVGAVRREYEVSVRRGTVYVRAVRAVIAAGHPVRGCGRLLYRHR